LDKPLLEPLASTLEESKRVNIDTQKYLDYLKTIRKIAKENGITPAEVDMALFAYSDEVVPLSRDSMQTLPKSLEKALKMMNIVREVAESARKVGYPRQATKLLNAIEPLVEKEDYEGIYKMCINITAARPDMDEKIERQGGKSLRSQLHRIKEVLQS
jgi:predicted transcriptional regulator